MDITSTKDGKFITVNSNSRTSSEEGICLSYFMNTEWDYSFLVICWSWFLSQVYVIDSVNPSNGLQKLCNRTSGVQYFVEHHSGFFYILTNAPIPESQWSGQGYYLARCRVEDIESAKLQVFFISFVHPNFEFCYLWVVRELCLSPCLLCLCFTSEYHPSRQWYGHMWHGHF